ncbi:MAG TPA: M36 family metallopeptidase [Pyrinomonadaceae bacterium]|nr:M36 family metallopeptidase [Pyrinomonadaceae bacterium]
MKPSTGEGRRSLLLTLFLLATATAIAIAPIYLTSAASKKEGEGLYVRTVSHQDDLPNYDIRSDRGAIDRLAEFRSSLRTNAAEVADIRADFVNGEKALAKRVPTLKIEYNTDIRIPEVIAPDVKQGRAFLTGGGGGKRPDVLKNFLSENAELVGMRGEQISGLKVASDYTNPDGNLSFVELNQQINGIPVFRGEVKAGFAKSGEMIRVINNLAPGLDYGSLSTEFGDPASAVVAAARNINHEMQAKETIANAAASTDLKTVFGTGDSATTAEKMYFPTEPGVAIPAWRVLIWQPVSAYYIIVDAGTGTMLWRKNLTEDQTQSATYNVYINPNAMINVADNPFPMTPGPSSPNGTQGGALSRTAITLIGNEAPYTFNQLGWITDGDNSTIGNNVHAGLDRKLPNSGSPANPADVDPDGHAVGSPNRVFNFALTPGNPNTNTGDAPLPAGQTPTGCLASTNTDLPTDFQKAITTSLFYISNRYHDELYTLGFTEAARNFQNTNFTGQGNGNDRVSAQAQDCSGTNNANFTTPADGTRPTMQMYLWTGPTPDFDGSLDADVIIHEYTHGLSNRLHGNSSGLSTNMARGMGEGWGDFYGHAMLSEPTDPIDGIYTTGSYDTYLGAAGFVNNYYYGIRRYPKAVIAATGGANNKPHNAFTFSYANSNCGTRTNNTNFAFARGPFGSATCDQVHNLGEIWSSTLWEVRAKFVTRLGWAVGNRKALQLVMDGMKLAPLGPTFLQERDAILAAAAASSLAPEAGVDVADVWEGFAARGMGFSATIVTAGTGGNTAVVTDGFDLPNLFQTPGITISDAAGDNDGYPEPGEALSITVPLTNSTGGAATNVTAQIVGGGSANYGTINTGSTVSQAMSYTVSAGAPCGSVVTITINVNSSLGATSFQRTFVLGQPITTATENFDGVTAPAFPAGWTAATVQSGINFVTTTNNANSAPNAAFALDPLTVGGGTNLTSPNFAITAAGAAVEFRNRYDTEGGWDGGVLEISINGAAFQDVITAGGTFIQNGYNGTLGAGANNPLANRPAWSGNSNGYITSVVRLPASAAGQNVQLRFRFGADDNTSGQGPNPGWYVDDIKVVGNYACTAAPVAVKSRADFDGDGKTDISVFRPSNGNWYLNQTTAGLGVVNWGLSGDTPVPGDYDSDGKTDFAVFRPNADPAVPDYYILNSNGFTVTGVSWGVALDKPVIGDYDNDGKTDVTVYRPGNNTYYILKSSGGSTVKQYGVADDVPIAGDFVGDSATDIAIFRPSTNSYWILNGSGDTVIPFGTTGDIPVPADYDNDDKTDIAVFRPSTGQWAYLPSTGGAPVFASWGAAGDVPVPGDYDGDGRDDFAIYRNGTWWINRSTAGTLVTAFGLASDKAIPNTYIQ